MTDDEHKQPPHVEKATVTAEFMVWHRDEGWQTFIPKRRYTWWRRKRKVPDYRVMWEDSAND